VRSSRERAPSRSNARQDMNVQARHRRRCHRSPAVIVTRAHAAVPSDVGRGARRRVGLPHRPVGRQPGPQRRVVCGQSADAAPAVEAQGYVDDHAARPWPPVQAGRPVPAGGAGGPSPSATRTGASARSTVLGTTSPSATTAHGQAEEGGGGMVAVVIVLAVIGMG
jgi:hypothetical protein